VLLVLDQFRADYSELYSTHWTAGLRRLFSTGAVFPLAEYPYGGTVTCPGHFTIGTGALPNVHGMVANNFFDAKLGRASLCTADAAATSVPFAGGEGREHHSAARLLTPTFAEQLRAQSKHPPYIVSVSLKPRSAIGLVGRGGPNTMVIWEEAHGVWATSDAYTRTPWGEVDAHIRANPMSAAYGTAWDRARAAGSYWFADDAAGEASPAPWGRTFPHKLETQSGAPDAGYLAMWERSPHSDEYIAGLATSLVTRVRLGQHPGTDVLALSFSALDLVGHEYGPRSQEVQDVLIRLDVLLGKLFDTLDEVVGRDRYVVAMSSDHGVAPLPEQMTAAGLDAGRISSTEIRTATQTAIVKVLGDGMYYGSLAEENIYLRPGVMERLRTASGAVTAVKRAIAGVNGISRVYDPDDLSGTAATTDPFLKAWRLSYVPGRSGDFVVVPRPHWIIDATGTNHGTPYAYDTRVPVVLLGAGIQAGTYLTPASPADIAPTLAWLTGITLAHSDGRVLTDALTRR
jgi:predicted AlkP superfamily pyrophosphatase or phosphodiesterase